MTECSHETVTLRPSYGPTLSHPARHVQAVQRRAPPGAEPFAAGHGDVYRVHASDTLMSSKGEDWVNAEKTQAALAAKFSLSPLP